MNTRNYNSRNSNNNYRNQNYNTRNQNYSFRNEDCGYCNQNYDSSYDTSCHVHEVMGSTASVSECNSCHNHRFCTMSGEPIRMDDSHVHEIKFRTDFADGHYHEYCGKSSKAISVGNGKHVHFASDYTESENGHRHQFQAASAIDSPQDFRGCQKD